MNDRIEKYSDYIIMQDFLPVYDMKEESSNLWKTFIPTKQFCDLLQKSISAITSNDINKRRSMWVRGTFGTGKSHASSVVRHLLCDDIEQIKSYVQNINNESLKEQLLSIRDKKRYFPVILKGVESVYDIPRFSLSLQRETRKALSVAGYNDLIVNSDFDQAILWAEEHKNRIEEILDKDNELSSEVSSYDKLISKLKNNDIDVFVHLEQELAKDKTYLTSDSISDWLVEVSNIIKESGVADGLIIFWDEFTSVMDTLKSDRINILQNIAEKSQQNDVFLFLISHRVEATSLDAKGKDITKMSDRYEMVDYKMDEVSTYRILRHTFNIDDTNIDPNLYVYAVKQKIDESIYQYLNESGNIMDIIDIKELFPMHPYTAFLCSKMANIMGSANRSVLKFMNDENCGFKAFINDDYTFGQKRMLTADWLWDFFYSDFENESSCTAFTNIFTNYSSKVSAMGGEYMRVFKVILLLNALCVKFKGSPEKFTPNEHNINYIFSGDRCQTQLEAILKWFDESNIVNKDVFGEFKISTSSYNPAEITNEKRKTEINFKSAVNYIENYPNCKNELISLFAIGKLMRKCEAQLYSCDENESVLRSKLSKYAKEKPNYLHIALFFAITEEQKDIACNSIKNLSEDYPNVIFIVPFEVLTTSNRDKFIDIIAMSKVARSHYQDEDALRNEKVAEGYIQQWKNRICSGTYQIYFRGETHHATSTLNTLYRDVNRKFAPQIFTSGVESVKTFYDAPSSFFENKNHKKLSLNVLQKRFRNDFMASFNGATIPAKKIFMDGDNNLIDEQCQLNEVAKNGNSWLCAICTKVDELMANAKSKYIDKFSLGDVLEPLMRAPYGLFANAAHYTVLSFALRKHKEDLFNISTSQPLGDERLNELITILLQIWDKGVNEDNKNLYVRFGSKEERDLASTLAEIFDLGKVKVVDTSKLKTIDYTKWAIAEYCQQITKLPLWSVLYCEQIQKKETCIQAIRELIDLLYKGENYPLAKIKQVYKQINSNGVDIRNIVSNTDNYKEGFDKFINDIEDVKIEKEWQEELYENIYHLPSDVAYWEESEVVKCVYGFYIKKIKPEAEMTISDSDTNTVPQETQKENIQTIVQQAKQCIRNQTMPGEHWKLALLEILDKHPEFSQIILNYFNE